MSKIQILKCNRLILNAKKVNKAAFLMKNRRRNAI